MAISNIPLFSMLRTKMHWHQERQRVLAENVANADTPRFQPRDLAPPQFDPRRPATSELSLARTSTRILRARAAARGSSLIATAASSRGPPATPSASKTR